MKPIATVFLSFLLSAQLQSQSPLVIAPPDIVVSCGFQFTENDLLDTSGLLFGRVVIDSSTRKKIHTYDIVCHKMCEPNTKTGYPGPIPPNPPSPPASSRACDYYHTVFDTTHKERMYDLTWGFDGYLKNAIRNEIAISVEDNRTCHQGKITRTFSTPGPNNTLIKATQTIWIVDCNPFYINPLDPCDTTDDIVWPYCGKELVLYGCGATPPDSIQPKMRRDSCSIPEVNFTDDIITNDPDYCFTLIRTWTVTDRCQYDSTTFPKTGQWTYDQIIHVLDTIKPISLLYRMDCAEADSTGFGNFISIASAQDDCTPKDWLSYRYWIDINNDGAGTYGGYDLYVGTLTPHQISLGQKPAFKDNPFAINPNDPQSASGKYPIGKHKFVSEIMDGCGNIARDSFNFEVLPAQAPKFECPTHEFTVPVELPQTYVFTLKNIVIFYEDNCTPYANLKVYLDGDTTKTKDLINCIDYLENGSRDTLKRNYEAWIQDAAGNTTVCLIHVNYVFHGNCDSLQTKYYSGTFFDRKHHEIEDLKIEIASPVIGSLIFPTGCSNSYKISNFDTDTGYYLLANKHDHVNNGIDVLDLIYLRSMILGTGNSDVLTSYAADVNNSNSITTSDANYLIKRILRTLTNLPDESDNYWIFFNGRDTSLTKPYLYVKDTTNSFIGVKIGDVNGDALPKCNAIRKKPADCLNLEIEQQDFIKGNFYTIPITSTQYNSFIGFQASFQFDPKIIKLEGAFLYPANTNNNLINLTPELLNQGVFNLIYYYDDPNPTSSKDTLFFIKFTALENSSGTNILKVIDEPTYSIAYDSIEKPYSICINGIPTKTSDVHSDHLMIYPNPTNGNFNVRIPENVQSFVVKIYDALGRVVYSSDHKNFSAVLVSIPGDYLQHPGAYYVTLQTKDRIFNTVLIKQ